MIDQVVTNLLENAVKYTPPGTPIDVAVERLDDPRQGRNRRSRPGHPARQARRVFDKFYRLE